MQQDAERSLQHGETGATDETRSNARCVEADEDLTEREARRSRPPADAMSAAAAGYSPFATVKTR